jgi:hypothetical protein
MVIILILPPSYIIKHLSDTVPPAARFKLFNNRLALFWDIGEQVTDVTWKLAKSGNRNLGKLCAELNSDAIRQHPPTSSGAIIDDALRKTDFPAVQESSDRPLQLSYRLPTALGVRGIDSNRVVAALAMEGANPWQRIIVYACFGIILLSIILGVLPPYTTEKQLGMLAMLIAALATALIMVVVRYTSLRNADVQPDQETAWLGNHLAQPNRFSPHEARERWDRVAEYFTDLADCLEQMIAKFRSNELPRVEGNRLNTLIMHFDDVVHSAYSKDVDADRKQVHVMLSELYQIAEKALNADMQHIAIGYFGPEWTDRRSAFMASLQRAVGKYRGLATVLRAKQPS